jgi:serine/threonine-protein kinase
MACLGERYRLVERLGAGGMSVVWRAFDEVLGRQVAVKLLAGDYAANPDFRLHMRHEARAAARLTHPHIGVVYDYGESCTPDGLITPYVVMELIDGPALGERLRTGPLHPRAALGVCAQVAEGLDAAHARGLAHRDVKPGNVMLCTAGVKVVDFGISALVGDQADRAVGGRVLGTPAYVAPERLTGAPVGTEADVYALGVVLFKTVTGRSPWHADGPVQMLAAHLTERPEPLPEAEGVPAEVQDLYLRCLAKDPHDRPAAGEAAEILAAAAGLATTPSLAAPELAVAPPHGEEYTTLLPSDDTTPPVLATFGTATVPVDRRTVRGLLGARGRRRATAVLAALPLAGLVGGLIVTTNTDHHPQVEAAAAAPAAPPRCAVTYRVGTDDGAAFTGTLTFDGRRPEPAGGWSLSFDLPAEQTFSAASPGTSTQDGGHVVVRLAGSGTVAVPFTGTYRDTNPLPATFVANGHPCTPLLIGPGGVPQSTSDGAGVAAVDGTQAAAPAGGGGQAGGGGDSGGKPAKDKGKGKDG